MGAAMTAITTLAPVTDPAMIGSNFKRRELDFYPTPEWVSAAVLPTLKALRPDITTAWECACGDGAMSEVLKEQYLVWSSDIFNYGYEDAVHTDFLAVPDNYHSKRAIITNPPYGDLAEAFIRQALRLTKHHRGMVAMLLRNEYDTAKGRVDLFNQYPFACKLVLTTRPRWIPGTTGAPRHSYAWFIWDWEHFKPPMLRYHVRGGNSE
jgi:hypothetical protein